MEAEVWGHQPTKEKKKAERNVSGKSAKKGEAWFEVYTKCIEEDGGCMGHCM